MEQIKQIEKDKINSYIESNDLDYTIMDSDIFGYSLLSMDNKQFKVYENEGKILLIKVDLDQLRQYNEGNIMLEPYTYFNFNNITYMLEQLKSYDEGLPKSWWQPIVDVTECGVSSYKEDWYEEFIDQGFVAEQYGSYMFLTYTNEDYKPELKSPFNTLHEVSELNRLEFTKVNALNIEIQPMSCISNNETYLFKIRCNNDEIFKEYINYKVIKKKGLKLLIKETFSIMEKFKVNK